MRLDIRTYRYGSDSIKTGTVLGHEFVSRVIDATKLNASYLKVI